MTDTARPLMALLIDADNVPARHAEAILREVKTIGEPALRRVYGDWTSDNLTGWSEKILSLGLAAQQATANTTGKNASDIQLVIDAMDILHTGHFDGFVLVSSDSDFTALASRLRENGLTVIGIGEKKTPEALTNVCNRFIFIENLISDADKQTDQGETQSLVDLNHAYQRISNAMGKIDQEDDWFNLSQVKNAIVAAHPDFDQRSYGHAKFSSLVYALPDKLETKTQNNRILVRLKP